MLILLVDDHALFREGVEMLLQRLDPTFHVAHAPTLQAAQAHLAHAPLPDLVLTDLQLPGQRGLDALVAIRSAGDGLPTAVLAGSEDPLLIRGAIDHGAMGYIPKSVDSRELAKALDTIVRGGVYLPSMALSTEQVGRQSPAVNFTARQREVLRMLVQGHPNKTIARLLDISEATVKTHVAAVLAELGVHSRTQAVYALARLGIVP